MTSLGSSHLGMADYANKYLHVLSNKIYSNPFRFIQFPIQMKFRVLYCTSHCKVQHTDLSDKDCAGTLSGDAP